MQRIEICARDIYEKDKILSRSTQESEQQPLNYRDLVVLKPWGYEYLIYENKDVAIWFLHIKKGHSTSMHCHPKKKTSLALLKGKALCNTFERRAFVSAYNGVTINKGVFHSTLSESDGGIELIELETPVNKTDLIRFNDKYGRETKGYEQTTQMMRDQLERFGHFDINAALEKGDFRLERPDYNLELKYFKNKEEFQDSFKVDFSSLYQVLEGDIILDEHPKFHVGDQFITSEIADYKVTTSGPLTLLQISP